MKTKRTSMTAIYLIIVIVICVVIFKIVTIQEDAATLSQTPSTLGSPPVLSPLHGIALGAIVITAAGILFFLNTRYGPLITFTTTKPSQQSVAQPKQRSKLRSLIFVFIAIAVMVGLYSVFVEKKGDVSTAPYEPPIEEASSPISSYWLDLFILFGAAGAVALSLTLLALIRYGVIPYNERVRAAQSEEIVSPVEPVPPLVSPLVDRLTHLGFSQLTRYRVLLPGGEQNNQCWLFTHGEHKAVALIGWTQWSAAPGVLFTSFFHDNALLETRYPQVIRIKYTDYWADGSATSLEAAWEKHWRNLDTFSRQHGQLVVVDGIRTYQDWTKRTYQFLGYLFRRANMGQLLALPAALLTLSLALVGITLTLMSAGSGSAASWAVCLLPITGIVLLFESVFVSSLVGSVRKMR